MNHVLGVKSSGQIAMNIFVCILLTVVLGVAMFLRSRIPSQEADYAILMCFVLDVIVGIDIVIQSKKPSTMISCDTENLYLHYRHSLEVIKLEHVKQVIPRRSHSRGFRYTFGSVIVYTKRGDFKIGILSDVERVSMDIMDHVRKHIEVIV